MKEKVEKALEKIREMLKADGGNVELVEVTEDGIVRLRLTGRCMGCPMASLTLSQGIERLLKQEVSEIKKVEAV